MRKFFYKLRTVYFFFSVVFVFSDEFEIPDSLKEPTVRTSNKAHERLAWHPLVHGDAFRSIANHVVDETTKSFNSFQVKTGDVVFVGMPYLKFFIENIFPSIQKSFVLITSNGSGTIDERYIDLVNNPKVLFWFGRNITLRHAKIEVIPLGVCWFSPNSHYKVLTQYLKKLKANSYFLPKKITPYGVG